MSEVRKVKGAESLTANHSSHEGAPTGGATSGEGLWVRWAGGNGSVAGVTSGQVLLAVIDRMEFEGWPDEVMDKLRDVASSMLYVEDAMESSDLESTIIKWLNTDKGERVPGTQAELAESLGVSAKEVTRVKKQLAEKI